MGNAHIFTTLYISSIYLYKQKSCPSLCLSFTLIIHLGLLTSPYQLPKIKNPSSPFFKFATASKCGDQLVFYSRLKTKKWRKFEQHSIENHSHMAQSVVQLTCIQEVPGSNPGVEQIYFWISMLSQTRFLEFNFDNTVSYFAFQARMEAGLERNWTHVIWELEYVNC